jgi:serine/threonine-protein kinase
VPYLSDEISEMPTQISDLIALFTEKDIDKRPKNAGVALLELRRVKNELTKDAEKTPKENPLKFRYKNAVAQANRQSKQQDKTSIYADSGNLEFVPVVNASYNTNLKTEVIKKYALGKHIAPINQKHGLLSNKVASNKAVKNKDKKPKKPLDKKRLIIIGSSVLTLLLAVFAFMFFEQTGVFAKKIPTNVINVPYENAKSALDSAKINNERTESFSDTVQKDYVINTDPAPGTMLMDKNQVVKIVVSKGVQMIKIPDKIGNQEEQIARNLLASAGFSNINSKPDYSLTVKKGVVISVNPKEGSTVKHNDAITLTISNGPRPLKTPDLVGISLNDAQNKATALNIKLATTTQDSMSVPKGNIISQNPGVNSDIFEGSTVSLVVSDGPPLVKMPNLFGMGVDKAHQTLNELGLKYEDNRILDGALGIVRAQSQNADTMVPKGSTIVITIV